MNQGEGRKKMTLSEPMAIKGLTGPYKGHIGLSLQMYTME
jgi:hypothetical protein